MENTNLQPTPIVSNPVVLTPVIPPVAQPVPQPVVQPLVPPIQNPPKKSNLFLIILIIVIIILGIIFGVLVTKYLTPPYSSVSPLVVDSETANWLPYTNPILKYSIMYPPTWTLLDTSKGKLIEIYDQPDKTKSVGKIIIEKIAVTPSIIYHYVDTKNIGTISAQCASESSKTWCYLENGKTIKISILIIKDQDENYNLILDKILSTFAIAPLLANISPEQLSAGWYWGNREEKLPGTPTSWEYSDGGKNSCWHEVGVVCQFTPNATNYTCPTNGWIDCMPVLDAAKTVACSSEAMVWYKANCPNFQGAAL